MMRPHFASFFLFLSVSLADDCSPKPCGYLTYVGFPFWLENVHHPSCGFPSFKVTCINGKPQIRISSLNYSVKSLNFSDETLILSPVETQIFACGVLGYEFFLNSTPFSLLPSTNNLVFHYNCSNTSVPKGYKRLECGQRNNSLVGWSEDNNGLVACERVSRLPSVAPRSVDLGGLETVLGFGFFVKWRAVDCSQCRRSGGGCRYNLKQNRFGCLCGDRLLFSNCAGRNKTKKIIVGVSAGFGGILLATVFFFLYKRKGRKMQPNTSKLLSWTNSSELSQKKDLENGDDSISSPLFRYEELLDATDGFSPSNELGDGGFGTVYKGKLRDGRIVAVKRLYENNYKRVEQFRNEVDILNGLRHPNLVSLYGCTSRHSRELLLVYEFVPNGTVADHLHGHLASSFKLNWALRLRIAQETAAALAYLHATEPPIIHRDVKTTNILLDANFHVKVADFGLSRLFPLDVTHVSTAPQGTPGYVDPEYHQCYQLTDKSDVYSFGVVLVELISSKPAVDITRLRNEINLSNMAINKIQSGLLGELVDPGLGFESDLEVRRTVEVVAELAFRCLQSDKDMRPSMEDAVEVLSLVGDGGRERETEVEEKKTDEMVLLKALGPPLSPNSVAYNWSSKVTTPNISE